MTEITAQICESTLFNELDPYILKNNAESDRFALEDYDNLKKYICRRIQQLKLSKGIDIPHMVYDHIKQYGYDFSADYKTILEIIDKLFIVVNEENHTDKFFVKLQLPSPDHLPLPVSEKGQEPEKQPSPDQIYVRFGGMYDEIRTVVDIGNKMDFTKKSRMDGIWHDGFLHQWAYDEYSTTGYDDIGKCARIYSNVTKCYYRMYYQL